MTQRKHHEQPTLFAGPAAPNAQQGRRRERRAAPPLPTDRPRTPVEFSELWDIDQVADYLSVPKQTIYTWRTTGYGPRGFRVGKHLRWHAATVIQWTLGLESEQ